MKIKYSQDARDKLLKIKSNTGTVIVSKITKSVRGLCDAPMKCPSVESMIGIPNPYYFLHVEHYYVFYRIDEGYIFISNIYSERENFMLKMFGVNLRTQESIDYWGE